ncbi:MAG: hypothetical protein SH850_19940 [Planctomycetaceae bacterium]|nr:hypothetical protein [Planctomycetaceae bacterium]
MQRPIRAPPEQETPVSSPEIASTSTWLWILIIGLVVVQPTWLVIACVALSLLSAARALYHFLGALQDSDGR